MNFDSLLSAIESQKKEKKSKIVLQSGPILIEGEPLVLTDQQEHAQNQIKKFLVGQSDNRMMLIEGYAGTGKTTLLTVAARLCNAKGLSVAICAPTNKAVAVVADKVSANAEAEFMSLHSLLGVKMNDREGGQLESSFGLENSVGDYDVIIVDECSMIGRDLLSELARSLYGNKVIFVGDPCQLPPVGEKTQSATFTTVSLKVCLSEIVRQQKDNPIIKLSMMIRERIELDQVVTPDMIADCLPPIGKGVSAAVVSGSHNMAVWCIHGQKSGEDSRILAFTNYAAQSYNRQVHDAIYGEPESDEPEFSVGERVIAQSSATGIDEDGGKTELYNSEELVLTSWERKEKPGFDGQEAFLLTLKRDSGKLVRVYVPARQEAFQADIAASFREWAELKKAGERLRAENNPDYVNFLERAKAKSKSTWRKRKAFAELRHAYALTTHKSQGSTFDTALIDYNDLFKMTHRTGAFDFNRALYVAVTRPRKNVAVFV